MEKNIRSSEIKTPIYLVMPSNGLGGMEMRLAEIWLRLASKNSNLHLVISQNTYALLLARPDLGNIGAFDERVIQFDLRTGKWLEMMKILVMTCWKLPKGSVVHYLLNAPPLINFLLGHTMYFSWVSNDIPKPGHTVAANIKWLTSMVSLVSARRIDILTPSVAERLRRNKFLARRITITKGGSFANFDHFSPSMPKRDEVVFLGRTEARKNALAFVQAIPLITERLAAAKRSARFFIYGAPSGQEKEISRLLASEAYRGVEIERGHTQNPAAILAHAKVFVSLQLHSNYPSKALIEAMGCGCIPVINASGESRLMVENTIARYIPSNFTPDELAKAVTDVLLMEESVFDTHSFAVRKQAIDRFRIERQIEYYADFWGIKHDETI